MKMRTQTRVPPGTYHGTFAGLADTEHQEYGPGLQWMFEIDQGEFAGKTVRRTTDSVATKTNLCGSFWEMVSGLPFQEAKEHDSDDWLGHTGTIVVERSPSGDGVRVGQFTRDDAE